MSNKPVSGFVVLVCSAAIASALGASGRRAAAAADMAPDLLAFDDPTGQARTFTTAGAIDFSNPFFQDLGTNGRRCVTCHQPADGWTVAAAHLQQRFAESNGLDPIFANNDGSNCEGVVAATVAERQAAYSLLLSRGLIRVGLDVPPGADFYIEKISDPYSCGLRSTDTSLYRRPLPATNLRFLSAVMWDGRESSASTTILQDLAHQAADATLGHAQALQAPTATQVRQIVDFETSLYTAQTVDTTAGLLDAQGATGGPIPLERQPFFPGINDPVGFNPTGTTFTTNVFTLFSNWSGLASSPTEPLTAARLAVARGEAIFNSKPMTISGVVGLNGETFATGVTVPRSFSGSCTVCHDAPNAGSHSVKAPLNIGVTDPTVAPYLPIYTLRNLATHERVETTDPGRAMITGKWSDVGKFKGPVLRGLAARAPYFHNGMAATLQDVVEFYNTRFTIGLSAQEKADLVAFLRSL